MNLSREFVELGSIRRDGGTQVREKLDLAWVDELAELYNDGHELPDPVVMRDANDVDWLVDGFHRVAALEKLRHQGVKVEVLHGSLDMAKAAAARANTNGLQRTPGDKKRAILLMLSTVEGKKMGQRELSRHCGVSLAYVQKFAGAGVTTSGQSSSTSIKDEKRAARAALVREMLASDPSATTDRTARALGVDRGLVAKVRREMGLKNEREQAEEKLIRARELWTADPSLTVGDVKRATMADHRVLAALRDQMGIPAADVGAGRRNALQRQRAATEAPPSAPTRKSDPRDKAVVEHKPSHLSVVRHMPATRSPRVVALLKAYDDVLDHELSWAWDELAAKHESRMQHIDRKEGQTA